VQEERSCGQLFGQALTAEAPGAFPIGRGDDIRESGAPTVAVDRARHGRAALRAENLHRNHYSSDFRPVVHGCARRCGTPEEVAVILEPDDYYLEDGLIVVTRQYHLKRG
jgi:hypothetical protein